MRTLFAIVVIALTSSAWAQAQYETDLQLCTEQSQSVTVDNPGKAMQAIEDQTRKCMAGKGYGLPPEQQRQVTLYKAAQAVCNQTASARATRDHLTAAERAVIYSTCLKGHNYIQ